MQRITSYCYLMLLLAVMGSAAHADPRHGRDHHDGRPGHYHRYPTRGYVVRDLPRDRVVIVRGRERFFYSGGAFYAPRGPRFVVVAPPVGIFVPVLPRFYATVFFGGIPYYYANDTYYVWRERRREYEVVARPEDEGSAQLQSDDLFVYPKRGQSEEQETRDKFECYQFAAEETGFDPTRAGGGVPAGQSNSKRADYSRAMAACLEGRGYSVK
jgi:hypothetical protein